MLKPIIEYIDCVTPLFKKQYGLVERVTENTEQDPKTFPGRYKGRDEYESIDFELQPSYHRISGTQSIAPDESIVGCSKGVLATIPLVMVGVLKLAENTQYEFQEVADKMAYTLMAIQFPKSVRKALKAISIEIEVTSINSNRNQVWDAEHENIDMAVPFGYTLFSIGYNILIKGDSSCLNTQC